MLQQLHKTNETIKFWITLLHNKSYLIYLPARIWQQCTRANVPTQKKFTITKSTLLEGLLKKRKEGGSRPSIPSLSPWIY